MRLPIGTFALVFTLFVSLGFFTIWFYLALYLETEFKISAAQIGMIIGALPLISALLSWLGGRIADRIGELAIIRITTLGYIGVAIGIATSRNLAVNIALLMLFGLLRAGNVPVIRSLLSQADKGDGRMFRLRYITVTISVTIVSVMGFLWHPKDIGVYFYISILYFIAAFTVALIGFKPIERIAPVNAPAATRKNIQDKWLAVSACIIFGLLFWFTLSQFESNFPVYLVRRFGEAGEMIYKTEIVIAAIAALVLALLSDQLLTRNQHLNEVKIVALASVFMATSCALVFTLELPILIYLGGLLFIFGEVIVLPKIDSVAIPLTRGKDRATIMGLLELRQTAFFLGPFLGGMLLDWNWKFMAPTFFITALLIWPAFALAKHLVRKSGAE